LDPDVLLRTDGGTALPEASVVIRGAKEVAGRTLGIAQASAPKMPVLVNGAAGVVVLLDRRPVAVIGFTVSDGKIVQINSIADPERIERLDLGFLDR
jgi:hypothetical protein